MMGLKLISDTGTQMFLGESSGVITEISSFTNNEQVITNHNLDRLKELAESKIDSLLEEFEPYFTNERSTRHIEIEYKSEIFHLNLSKPVDNRIWSWYEILQFGNAANSIEVIESSNPI